MSILDEFAAALAEIYTEAGAVACVYTPPTGAASNVLALFLEGETQEQDGADALGTTTKILLQVAEVSLVETGSIVSIGTDDYEILWARKTKEGLEWLCNAAKR